MWNWKFTLDSKLWNFYTILIYYIILHKYEMWTLFLQGLEISQIKKITKIKRSHLISCHNYLDWRHNDNSWNWWNLWLTNLSNELYIWNNAKKVFLWWITAYYYVKEWNTLRELLSSSILLVFLKFHRSRHPSGILPFNAMTWKN